MDSRVRAGASRFGAIPDEGPAARISIERVALRGPGLRRSRDARTRAATRGRCLPPVPPLSAALPFLPSTLRTGRRDRSRDRGRNDGRFRRSQRALLSLQALLQPLPLHAPSRVGHRLSGLDAPASAISFMRMSFLFTSFPSEFVV